MWTFKAYYSLRVAEGDELVRPDARVSLGIVDQTWVAGGLMWFAINAFDITGATAVAVRIHTELILATWTTNRRIIGFAVAAIDSPIIIAMIVDSTVSVEQKSVFAIFVA